MKSARAATEMSSGNRPSASGDQSMSGDMIQTLKSIQDSMTSMNNSLTTLSEDVRKIKTEMSTIQGLKDSLEQTQTKLDNTTGELGDLRKKFEAHVLAHVSIIKQLNESKQQNLIMKENILHMDCYIRRENLKISGISEDRNESAQECWKKVRDMFVDNLDLDDEKLIEFQRCHRLGPKLRNANSGREIIVRFLRYSDREKIWSRRSKLKGTPIVLKEDFPPEIDQRRARLYPICKAARNSGLQASLVADKLYLDGNRYTVKTMDSLPDNLKPRNLAKKELDNAVLFYGRDCYLSNFYPCRFVIDGEEFSSVEQYFQFKKVCKLGDFDTAAAIMSTNEPVEQLRLGRKPHVDDSLWNNKVAKQIMEIGVRAKFDQNADLKKELLSTGSKLLVECNKFDKLWGNGLALHDEKAPVKTEWKGENALGEILIIVRESLK